MSTYAIPDPPPVDVTTLWDAHGIEWHRRPDIGDRWCQGLLAIDWKTLVYEHGPLSDTAPEGDNVTLADIAADCRSRAKQLREAATHATAAGNDEIAREATDRADIAHALAALAGRLARLPMANSFPPYVDAAKRLARLAGVDL